METNLMNINLKPALLLLAIALACTPAAFPQGRGRGRGGAVGGSGALGASGAVAPPQGRGGRFKIYPQDAVTRGLPAYNTTCGYCHGERGKGGNGGPDLITSDVTLHDDDGVGFAEHLKTDVHQKAVKLDLPQATVYDIASYLHSRIIATANHNDPIHVDDVAKAGDPKAGQAYFSGAGGCAKCHQPEGNLNGIGSRYDIVTLQDRIANPRAGGRGGGRGGGPAAPDPNAITATVTLANGQTFKGIPVVNSDFDVMLRLADGSTQTWARNNGIPKVELTDPMAEHLVILTKLKDTDLHNLTAYLATLK
jgi:cytochrome c oxidase cbb3-type subunit III